MQPPTLVTKDAVTEETSRTNAPGFRRVAFRAIATSAAAGAAHRFGAGWSRATEPPQESQASDWREPVLRRSCRTGADRSVKKRTNAKLQNSAAPNSVIDGDASAAQKLHFDEVSNPATFEYQSYFGNF